ncbi:hypothetical protein BaRGS_00030895, partial [Batillaria attramentaria]
FVKSFVIGSRIESSHMPLCRELQVFSECVAVDRNRSDTEWSDKLIWDTEKEREFVECLNSEALLDMMARARESVDQNIDQALQTFVDTLFPAGQCMVKRCKKGSGRTREAAWFDKECRLARAAVRKLLCRFRVIDKVNDHMAQ